jgi:hypothetical protein
VNLREIDRTKDEDLAVFRASQGFSILRVLILFVAVASWLVVPIAVSPWIGPFAMVGFPLLLLGWTLVLARTPSGRGALWVFGRGRSPSHTILALVVLTVGVAAFAMFLVFFWAPRA